MKNNLTLKIFLVALLLTFISFCISSGQGKVVSVKTVSGSIEID